jgi:hypothetical protein
VAWQGNGMVCVHQKRPHCLNQMGKTQSKALAEGTLSRWYNGKQRVELKFSGTWNYYSTWNTVKCGVPQGSVRRPLQLNIYMKYVPASIDNSSNVTMYAGDTSILISNNCCDELNRNFYKVLYNTLKWFQATQLVLNTARL